MKKNIFLILFFVAGMIAIIACRSRKHTPNQNDIVVFAPEAVIPSYNKMQLNTYQVSAKNTVTESVAVSNAKNLLTVMGEDQYFDLSHPVKENDRLFFTSTQDISASCIVNLRTGDIRANTGTKKYMDNNSTPDLLNEDNALKMAKQYLKQLNYADLNDASLVLAHIGGVNLGVHTEDQGNTVYKKFINVRFDRRLDSIPVLGHSRLIVQLAEKGKLHAITKQWPVLEKASVSKDVQVDPNQIKQSITQHLTTENKTAKKINVKMVNMVYYERNGLIEPALHIICTIQIPSNGTDTTLQTYPYDIVEPILKNPRIIYTYMPEVHKDQPVESGNVDTLQPPARGEDENRR